MTLTNSLLPRRQFLETTAASLAAASIGRTATARNANDPPPNHVTLRAGDLTAVIGANGAGGEHRSGYNGVWSLKHAAATRSLFVPSYAGLNLEHIVTGAPMPTRELRFEPRFAPMSVRAVDETTAELHQPPTPVTHVESWTRFHLDAGNAVDMEFRCVPRQDVFPHGYLALFWASYINAPLDKSLYFLGGLDDRSGLWTQFCTQWHNDQSTVRHRDDDFEMTFDPNESDALYKNLSRFRYDRPFFYGNFEDLMWQVMFDRPEGIRFTHSPSGGGRNDQRATTNPAWDFQLVIPDPQVGEEYGFRVRTVLRPRSSRDELLRTYENWIASSE